MTAIQQPQPVTATTERVRLYLSGGSNRAAFAAVGVIVYLATQNKDPKVDTPYRWSEVDEVIGVSGGSQAVASLIAGLRRTSPQGPIDDDSRAVESMQAFYDAHVTNAAHHKASHRWRYLLALLILIAIPIVLLVVFVFVGPPAPASVIVFACGILSMPLVYGLGRLVLRKYLHSFIADVVCASAQAQPSFPPDSVVANHKLNDYTKLARNNSLKRSYFLAVVGMSSGSDYAYFAGQGLGAADPWQISQEQEHAKLVDACTDSCALPPLSRRSELPPVQSPVDNGPDPKHLRIEEALLDGGYGGSFGVQIVHQVAGEIAHHNGAGNTGNSGSVHPNNRRIIAVDAGTAIGEEPKGQWIARAVSTVIRLLRIIQVSNAAVYRNDLEDLNDADGGIITVSQTKGQKPANLSNPTSTGTSLTVDERLWLAVAYNANLGLVNVNPHRAALATAIGVAGVYLADMNHRNDSVTEAGLATHLKEVGMSLGVGTKLLVAWMDPAAAWPKVKLK